MLGGLTLLLLFQCVGEVIVHGLKLPFPGPVLGMLLLVVTLGLRASGVPANLHEAGHGILRHLSLLFVPAGVGVMLYYRALVGNLIPVLVVLAASTAATIAVTALAIRWLGARPGAAGAAPAEPQ